MAHRRGISKRVEQDVRISSGGGFFLPGKLVGELVQYKAIGSGRLMSVKK